METIEEVLAHFGVKGMHWGVRRRSKIDTSSEDAKGAAEAKAKIKKGGTKSLSNKELQALVTRMNLEQQFDRLSSTGGSSKVSKGKKAVQAILTTGKTANDVISFVNSPAGQMIRKSLLSR